jgi:hypothetical protein
LLTASILVILESFGTTTLISISEYEAVLFRLFVKSMVDLNPYKVVATKIEANTKIIVVKILALFLIQRNKLTKMIKTITTP